jgi:hypothetical protein
VAPKEPETPKTRVAASVNDPKAHLASACGGDEKCVCVNNAIFKHDSSWATANNPDGSPSVGKRANNPCNMRVPAKWEPSVAVSSLKTANGTFAKFDTLHDGITACVELYQRYQNLSPSTLVRTWTNGGGSPGYHAEVSSCYL